MRSRRRGSLADLLRQRSSEARAQDGFALVFVLGAIALTSVVIVALLGLALTSSRVTVSQRERAQEQRAAAGAIEAAVGQIAHSDPAEPCSAMPDPAVAAASLVFEPDGPGGGTTVEVECWSQDLTPTLPSTGVAQPQLVSMTPGPNVNGQHRFGTVDGMSLDCILGLPPCRPAFTTTWSSAGTEPLRSASLLFQSHEGENVHNLDRNISARVTTSSGQCSVTVPGGRTNDWAGARTSVDLFTSQGCRDLFAGATQGVLDGATIRVEHRYVAGDGCPLVCRAALTVGQASLLTNVDVIEATTASGAGWSNVAAVGSLDGTSAAVSQSNCTPSEQRCRIARPGDVFTVTLSGFDVAGSPAAGGYLDSVGAVIDSPRNNPRSWISDVIDGTWFEVVLSVGGVDCTARHDGFARSSQQIYVDLLDKPGCREALQNADDLSGATLTYSVKVDCLHIGNVRAPVDGSGRCPTVTLANLDRIALAVTTAPLARESIVTLSASVGGDVVGQADVYFDGEAAAPRPTPVVSWRYDEFVTRPPSPTTP